MARTFVAASSEKITLSLGALGFVFGPGTVAAIIHTPATLVGETVFSAGAAASTGFALSVTAGGLLDLGVTGASHATSVTALAISKWYCVASTKATGTVAPRFHIYDYTVGTWVHENSASTIANSLAPATRAALGVNAVGTGSFFDGAIGAAGTWNVVLTDSQVESLAVVPTPASWNIASALRTDCKGLWFLRDPVATTVTDLTGGGANQSAITGTTLTTDDFPLFNLRPSALNRQFAI